MLTLSNSYGTLTITKMLLAVMAHFAFGVLWHLVSLQEVHLENGSGWPWRTNHVASAVSGNLDESLTVNQPADVVLILLP